MQSSHNERHLQTLDMETIRCEYQLDSANRTRDKFRNYVRTKEIINNILECSRGAHPSPTTIMPFALDNVWLNPFTGFLHRETG